MRIILTTNEEHHNMLTDWASVRSNLQELSFFDLLRFANLQEDICDTFRMARFAAAKYPGFWVVYEKPREHRKVYKVKKGA